MNYAIPNEIQDLINSNLSYTEITNLCQTNSALAARCNNPQFWKDLLMKRYPDLEYPITMTPREAFYHFESQYNVLVYDSNRQLVIMVSSNDLDVISGAIIGFLVACPRPIVRGMLTLTGRISTTFSSAYNRYFTATDRTGLGMIKVVAPSGERLSSSQIEGLIMRVVNSNPTITMVNESSTPQQVFTVPMVSEAFFSAVDMVIEAYGSNVVYYS